MARPNVVEVIFTGDTTKFHKATQDVESKTESVGSKLKGVFAGLGGAAAAFGAVSFFKGSIDAASDLNESLSKTQVVFGDSAKAVQQFAETSAKELGISKRVALEATGTFGNLFSALGLGQKPAADMSKELVKLAADLASFNNVKPEDALEALRSGLLGEAEPLRKFGVSLSDARIQAEALAIGLVRPKKSAAEIDLATQKYEESQKAANKAIKQFGEDNIKAQPAIVAMEQAHKQLEKALAGEKIELTAAQKAQAAYSIIMKDTATAHGDFSRTSDGLANRQRILKAEFDDMQSKLGQKLLPVMTNVEGKLIGLVNWFSNLSPGMQQALGIIGGLILAFAAVSKVAAMFNAVLALNPIGLVVIALAALVGGLILAYKHSETFRNIVDGAFRGVAAAAGFMKDLVVGYFQFIVDKWLAIAEWIVRGAATAFGWVPGIGPKLKEAAKAVEQFRDDVNFALDGIHTEKKIRITTDANVSLLTVKGARAGGGPVGPGSWLVGEEGPEVLTLGAGRSGFVIPNSAMAVHVDQIIVQTQKIDENSGKQIIDAINRASNRGYKIPTTAVS